MGIGRWDIQEAGVRGILDNVDGQRQGFSGMSEQLGTAISSAGEQAGSGWISEALSYFAEAKQGDVQSIDGLIQSAHSGAGEALNAYLGGDQQMAANANTGQPDPGIENPGGGYNPESGSGSEASPGQTTACNAPLQPGQTPPPAPETPDTGSDKPLPSDGQTTACNAPLQPGQTPPPAPETPDTGSDKPLPSDGQTTACFAPANP